MKKRHYFFLMSCCYVSMAFAQSQSERSWFTERQYFSTSVNNEGEALVHSDQCQPIEIWNPRTNDYKQIGGVASGNGIGGVASFSDDGKKISSTMLVTDFDMPDVWTGNVVLDGKMSIKKIMPTWMNKNSKRLFAVAADDDCTSGDILVSSNSGQTWRQENYMLDGNPIEALVSLGMFSNYSIFAGGYNGALYYTKNEGAYWQKEDARPEGCTDEVSVYRVIYFQPFTQTQDIWASPNGVFGVELADGTGGIYFTTDTCSTTHKARGVEGVPMAVTNVGQTYFLVTANGKVQRSDDFGATWTTVFVDNAGSEFCGIAFTDDKNGVIVGNRVAYRTADGGATWSRLVMEEGVSENVKWNDVAVMDDGRLMAVGNTGNIYESADNGATWKRIRINDNGGVITTAGYIGTDLYAVAGNSDAVNIGGTGGNLYYKREIELSGYGAGIYDVESGEWTAMPCTGYLSGGSASSADDISGDGTTIVGSVYDAVDVNGVSTVVCNGGVWNNGDMTVLENKFADKGRAAKAVKTNYDGSVIVGWQDLYGPWMATVWRRQGDGTYNRQTILAEEGLTEDDVNWNDIDETFSKTIGMCNAVSSDGKIIGGRSNSSNFAFDGAWLWSEEKGLQRITDSDDMVYDMTNDGSFVVGQVGTGASSWVWTEAGGKVELNSYVQNTLGIDLQGHTLCGVYDLSPNGRYITGWCMKGYGKFAYVIDLKGDEGTGIDKAQEQIKAAVYPNPVATELHIDLPYDNVATKISLYSTQGACVKSMNATGTSNVMNVGTLPDGVYILDVNADGVRKTFKVMVRH